MTGLIDMFFLCGFCVPWKNEYEKVSEMHNSIIIYL